MSDNSNVHTFTVEVEGQTITIETGKLANQANGAVTVRHGDTVILATVTMAPTPRVGVYFFPLPVYF